MIKQGCSEVNATTPVMLEWHGLGLLRESQIIGRRGITPEAAENNQIAAAAIRKQYPPKTTITAEQARELAKKLAKIGPRSVTPAIPPIIPWSKSKLWQAVAAKEFPAPIKLSERTTAWTVQSVKEFLQRQTSAGGN